MAVDSYAAASLAKAMAHSILDSSHTTLRTAPHGSSLDPKFVSASILGLTNDIQARIKDAMVEATTIFPHKPPATSSKDALPRHLWPKSVRHDIANIRRRAKVIRRFIKHETRIQADAHGGPLPRDPSLQTSMHRYLFARSLARRPKTYGHPRTIYPSEP